MLAFIIGCIVGGLAGLLFAGLMGAASYGDREHEIYQAYLDGIEAGQKAMQARESLAMVRQVGGAG
jgi:hypothetical protein